MQMAVDYVLKVNGVDFGRMVEIDSYHTSLEPVYGDSVTTMDGVEHIAVIRYRGAVEFTLNPQTDTASEKAFAALLKSPLEVYYHCLQRNADVIASMKLDSISAQHLGRARFCGRKWNEIPPITLMEL